MVSRAHMNAVIMLVLLFRSVCVRSWNFNIESYRQSLACGRGCVKCDETNGCLLCRRRMFLYISMERGRQYGTCKHECPEGYFGQRGREMNTCSKCEVANCKTCFTSDYCTTCQDKFFLDSENAKCVEECPSHLYANPHNGKCEDKVDCVVGPWSSWGKCARRSASRSCKYGRKKRTRQILQHPTENGRKCGKLRETKKCKTPSSECICEWNRDMINKWIQKMEKRMRQRRRKKERKRGKKRNKRKKTIQDNSTIPRLIGHTIELKNVTSSVLGQTER
ncbi:R-spondin-2-like isoform X1 [Styela clava]